MSNEPIYKQVIRDVEERAEVGKATYGRYLMEDVNGRNPLQDAYEEQIDGAKYLKQAIHERRALIDYVTRLEWALRKICENCASILDEPETDTEMLVTIRKTVDNTLATSPLAGQPKPAPATGWRPIAEAPRDGTPIEAGDPDSGFVRVVQYASECGGAWYLLGSADTYYAFDSFTVFRPVPVVPAPPKEGE